jgi:2-polyprenyl-6-methoxyphenol hydroxylase-like FAD-dependent oxidoreductase
VPASAPRAAIAGGSLGGLFAAAYLSRIGWTVDVYERNATELAGRGAGIATHRELHAALRAAGIDPSTDLGVKVDERRVYALDGSVAARMPFPQTTTSWDRLFRWLRELVPAGHYHLGKALARIDQDADKATLTFADGSTAEADLVIAADGFRSAVRAQFLPQVEADYVGYVAWRGLVNEAVLTPDAHADLFGAFGFCLPAREQMLGYPVAGRDNDLRPGHRQFNFVWYRPASADDLARMMTDASGKLHPLGIPPPLIRAEVLEDARAAASRTLSPAFAQAVHKTDMLFFQPIYDLTVPRMAFGRVALIGDAAFVVRPHVGAGVTKAAEDALSLAHALRDTESLASALARFEQERLPMGERIVARARDLGAYMQAQLKTPAEQAAAETFRTPQGVMEGTASLAFLAARTEA